MRFRFFLCASADLGVRRTKVSSSFCRSGYIVVLEDSQAAVRLLDFVLRSAEPPQPMLEVILQCKLYLPRSARSFNAPEIRAVGDIAVRLQELRVIHQVEKL